MCVMISQVFYIYIYVILYAHTYVYRRAKDLPSWPWVWIKSSIYIYVILYAHTYVYRRAKDLPSWPWVWIKTTALKHGHNTVFGGRVGPHVSYGFGYLVVAFCVWRHQAPQAAVDSCISGPGLLCQHRIVGLPAGMLQC